MRRTSESDTRCVQTERRPAMAKMIVAAACSLALVIAAAASTCASAAPRMAEVNTPSDKAAPINAQRQKRRECALKWSEQKAKTGVKGRVAYRKFMRECRKTIPARG